MRKKKPGEMIPVCSFADPIQRLYCPPHLKGKLDSINKDLREVVRELTRKDNDLKGGNDE